MRLWNNNNWLGMIVYVRQPEGSYKTLWSTDNVRQGAGALAWLTADLDGQGKTSIVQPWDNDGSLGLIVYAPQPDGSYKTVWATSDWGKAPVR